MKRNNIKIAVTGGIGSGKSTVCKIIEEAGYPVFSCDSIYAELLNCGVFTENIITVFGNDVSDGRGGIDKKKLAQLVFSDREKLEKLNEITHPVIFSEIFKKAEALQGLVFFEVPVLFERGYQNLFDEIIVVVRELDARVRSVAMRDGLTVEEVERRITNQVSYNKSNFTQYYVIHNNCKISNMCDIINDILLKLTNKHIK